MEALIENFHINVEETRNQISHHIKHSFPTEASLPQCHMALASIYHDVQNLYDAIPIHVQGIHEHAIDNDENIWGVMVENCKQKACQLARNLCQRVTATEKKMKIVDHHESLDSQAAVAQIVELTIRLVTMNEHEHEQPHQQQQHVNHNDNHNETINEITKQYTSYQRALLRNRSKPSIANVAQIRKLANESSLTVAEYIHELQIIKESESDLHNHQQRQQQKHNGMDEEEYKRYHKQPYAHSITVILGEASSLLHPLMMWQDGIHGMLSQLHASTTSNGSDSTTSTNDVNVNANQRRIHHTEQNIQMILMEMCNDAIQTIHQEAQHLCITIGNWFVEDTVFNNETSSSAASASAAANNKNGCINLTILDNTLDEMAYVCQVIHRYCDFSRNIPIDNSATTTAAAATTTTTLKQHLHEQSLHYSTTETKLTTANLVQAFKLATPVELVLGSEIYVPSIVEDAYFISTRALERASGTLENKAIWTIALWVVDIWSTDDLPNGGMDGDGSDGKSVCHALMNQKGCTVEQNVFQTQGAKNDAKNENGAVDLGDKSNSSTSNNTSGKNALSSFSSALLDAFDQDIMDDNHHQRSKKNTAPKSGPSSLLLKAPLSGTILKAPLSGSSLLNGHNNVDVRKVQMDTQFCTLNGINAASSACKGLVDLFDSLVASSSDDDDGSRRQHNREDEDQQSISMIKFAKEQLESHSRSYTNLLSAQVKHIVFDWCGSVLDKSCEPPFIASLPQSPCIHRIFYYISHEVYNLDSNTFHQAETDERLDRLLISPLKDSRLMTQIHKGKCDEGVTLCFAQELSNQVLSLMLSTILEQKKSFSDWGSLLLSKQIRLLEHFFCSIILKENHDDGGVGIVGDFTADGFNTSKILYHFQKIKQAMTILQLDKPSDWSSYAMGDISENHLSREEIKSVMQLRCDWSIDVINAICSS